MKKTQTMLAVILGKGNHTNHSAIESKYTYWIFMKVSSVMARVFDFLEIKAATS